eukprot:GILI01004838.1.p1 GENE.GILI01004838.1~~GILI01004838.1.p1  ORF type:complete len:123 (+),score=28.02 GILI01004838.1:44-412(+)
MASSSSVPSAPSLSSSSSTPSSTELFSAGIIQTLNPAIQELDKRAQEVQTSQQTLLEQIDRLSDEMDKFEAHLSRPVLTQYTQKLKNSRRKLTFMQGQVSSIANRLQTIERRISKHQEGHHA